MGVTFNTPIFSPIAFLKFSDEQSARQAFNKGDNLKIGGLPVDVFFSRANSSGMALHCLVSLK